MADLSGNDQLDTEFRYLTTGTEWMEAVDTHDWLPLAQPAEDGTCSTICADWKRSEDRVRCRRGWMQANVR
jgi:hypothetical protein